MRKFEESLAGLLASMKELNVAIKILEKYPKDYSEKLIRYDIEKGLLDKLGDANKFQLKMLKKQNHFYVMKELFGEKKIDNILNNEIRKRKLNKIV